MYFLKSISDEAHLTQTTFQQYNDTMKLVFVALLAGLAAILQSFGGFLPGVGFLISPLATAPILICSMFSIPYGFLSYLLTVMILFILEPTELIIFPFTTGLLGFGIGAAFHLFKKRISIIAAGSFHLSIGIIGLLYILRFPILGPIASDSFSLLAVAGILLFTFLYSWLWVEIALFLINRIKRVMS